MTKAGIEFSCQGAVIIPAGADVEDVIVMLRADTHLTSLQLDQIRIFDFDPGSSDLAWLSTATTVQQLIVAEGAPEVAECLQRGAIETYFQPIVAAASKQVIGYEALSRGRSSSGSVISPYRLFSYAQQTDSIFFLDRLCRETSIRTAASRDLHGRLFVNFLPNAIYDPRQCLKTTLAIADTSGFDPRRIVLRSPRVSRSSISLTSRRSSVVIGVMAFRLP
jgi:predicted signal transduction protein with EAL and GGDEF domain